FYVSRDNQLVAVPITPTSNAQPPDIGKPVALFAPPLGSSTQQGDYRHKYMVSADGQQFLVASVKEAGPSPIRRSLKWNLRPRSQAASPTAHVITGAGRTTRTGQRASRSTRSATLPSNALCTGPRPCEPSTIRSTDASFA